jgi:hypothetical protein
VQHAMHRWTHPLVKQKSADGWAGVEHETCQYIYIYSYIQIYDITP